MLKNIYTYSTFIVLILFFIVFFGMNLSEVAVSGSDATNLGNSILVVGVYALVGIIAFVLSYITSLKIFKNQEL
ncbi:hypothetical protein NGH74_01895 [Staphylococcus pseudoxylosus]|uniref:hypothetical protein n=2 Tax=Staphylococcus pseudoxylosus TaxID=2282419 RepID=UPI000D1E88E4|nr:hypothetical protein [Staphylococcus pseudoxylosus]MDW8797516.1 hypothetical protein [Staphylococcus pseudoxylosus]MEB6036562.1 hypothetical protein [Staphylococcus pseudoxylosus]MEB7763502.1 hypothetical protein [Staphylococcus pseudoxylosus]MEB8085919.1 hypothetical protein [Staphylococcus pseudoxylosus]